MSLKKFVRTISPVALAVFLASCGSGTTDNPTGADNEASAGNAPTAGAAAGTDQAVAGSSTQTISGRVADGYIRGATVCVDLNENDSCDTEEPSAITGPGGTYDLDIPAEAQDKPIVADIPAEAIDEDTGEAIGKPLVFVAPADKPRFVSPITTLVHQELQSNPALTADDAENAVKTLLGVDEGDVSLFADYVEGGSSDSQGRERREQFAFLHDTARVVASMMKDIETQVETAAELTGVDVVGSEETRRAIRDIVRREVRQLLPDIARQVVAIVESENVERVDGEVNPSADGRLTFDPDQLAISLRPEGVTDSVREKIDAVVERVDSVQADIRQALSDGVYWIEFDCEYYSRGIESQTALDLDEGGRADTDGESCSAFYGKAQLTDAGDRIESRNYVFDPDGRAWIEEKERFEDDPSDFALVDGQWQEINESGPDGAVTFTEDGIAQISNTEGVMSLKAVTRALDAAEVLKHFLADDADEAWYALARSTDLFSAGALSHTISVKQSLHPYVLFNAAPYDSAETSCLEFSGNCNVVGVESDNGFRSVSSLVELQESAISGIQLVNNSYVGPGASMKLMIDREFDGSLPTSGQVEWSFGYDYYPDVYRVEFTDDSGSLTTDTRGDATLAGADADVCYLSPETTDYATPSDEDSQLELRADDVDEERFLTEFPDNSTFCVDPSVQSEVTGDETPIVSAWTLIDVDGVEMIEIAIPAVFRSTGDYENSQHAFLLIEHEGVVRSGARLSESLIDRIVTYNEAAFSTLRAIVERGPVQAR